MLGCLQLGERYFVRIGHAKRCQKLVQKRLHQQGAFLHPGSRVVQPDSQSDRLLGKLLRGDGQNNRPCMAAKQTPRRPCQQAGDHLLGSRGQHGRRELEAGGRQRQVVPHKGSSVSTLGAGLKQWSSRAAGGIQHHELEGPLSARVSESDAEARWILVLHNAYHKFQSSHMHQPRIHPNTPCRRLDCKHPGVALPQMLQLKTKSTTGALGQRKPDNSIQGGFLVHVPFAGVHFHWCGGRTEWDPKHRNV
mmetsp:Transcript_54038/g.143840  ORF Transcript_54038/g.143840 Transcript_54038/m.143840 type:complete len:249 (+) Transcript_54038:480-1226(+)